MNTRILLEFVVRNQNADPITRCNPSCIPETDYLLKCLGKSGLALLRWFGFDCFHKKEREKKKRTHTQNRVILNSKERGSNRKMEVKIFGDWRRKTEEVVKG
uniref:Uncharacterized protein n=1 Tax=Cucumis sativus TaxID=3659 RepID=A0A0A0KLR2_CUCSA